MGELYKLNFSNGKSYIGITKYSALSRYKGHEAAVRRDGRNLVHYAWRKHGAPKLSVLVIAAYDYLLNLEQPAIMAFKTMIPFGYNMIPGGRTSPTSIPEIAAKVSASLLGKPRPQWVRDKIGLSNKGKIRSPEICFKLSEAHLRPETRTLLSKLNSGVNNPRYGITTSIKTRRKQSKAHKGKKHTAEHNANKSKALKGRVFTLEWKKKIGDAHKGRKLSKRHRAILCAAQQASWDSGRRTRTKSEETKIKLRSAVKANWAAGKYNHRKPRKG